MARYTENTCPVKTAQGKSKRRFATKEVADLALDRIWKLAIGGTTNNSHLPCRSYYCTSCRGYHHTSKPYFSSEYVENEVA